MAKKAEAKEEGAAAAEQAPPQVRASVLNQYIRDMSFENILAQSGGGEVKPDLKVAVKLDALKRPVEGQYEVISKINVKAVDMDTERNLFLLEMEYAGVFHIEGVPEEHLHPFLMIECPHMLFPFIRRIVSDVTRDGGFPPLNLDMIDFARLYRNEAARRQEAQTQAEGAATEKEKGKAKKKGAKSG